MYIYIYTLHIILYYWLHNNLTLYFRAKRLTNDSILQPFYNILTFERRVWPHTVLYRPHIVLLLDHILQCITPWRWPRGAETCRSACEYITKNILKVHSLDVIILNLTKMHGKHSIKYAACFRFENWRIRAKTYRIFKAKYYYIILQWTVVVFGFSWVTFRIPNGLTTH
jgi:hypothetical protein